MSDPYPPSSARNEPGRAGARYERFESMREYERMTNELVAGAQRVIRIFERSLGPAYNSAARYELLRAFLHVNPLRRLFVVVHEAASIERACPRFASLHQQFSSQIEVRVTLRCARHVHDPFVIFDASHYLHRFHYDHLRAARGMHEREGVQQLLQRFGELWDASTPARGASVMGL